MGQMAVTEYIVAGCMFVLLVGMASYMDIRDREIPFALPILIASLGVLIRPTAWVLLHGALAGLPYFIVAVQSENRMGGGILQSVIGLTAAIIYIYSRGKSHRNEGIPLIPFLAAGGILSYILQLLKG